MQDIISSLREPKIKLGRQVIAQRFSELSQEDMEKELRRGVKKGKA